MLLLLLICIIVLEARSVSLKQGENDRRENCCLFVVTCCYCSFFHQLEYWNITQSVTCGFLWLKYEGSGLYKENIVG